MISATKEELVALRGRVEELEQSDRTVDAAVEAVVDAAVSYLPVGHYTSSRDEVELLFEEHLPGWWWTGGSCGLTGHASAGPDYLDPEHRERLFREWPEERFGNGIDVDLTAGSGRTRATRALLCVFLDALIAREELREAAAAKEAV